MKIRSHTCNSTRSCSALLLAAGLALAGCEANQGWYTSPAAERPAEPTPTTPPPTELSLFGQETWGAPTALPADPIPLTSNPNSVNASRITFAEEGADFDPCVSSSGGFMVFASTQHSRNADIYLKNLGSTILTQLTNDPGRDVMPKISPDGQWIAFASDRALDWNIYVMPRAGGRPVQITWESAAELHPSWSPDGKQIAYSKLGQTSGRWEIWVTDVTNTSTPHFLGYGLFPEWCPKAGTGPNGGDLILFQRSADRGDRAFGIWMFEMKGGQVGSPSQLIGSPATAYINPNWSPDGRYVVFASVSDPHAIQSADKVFTGDSDLWMMSSDGNTMVSLTTGNSSDLLPAWGTDGNIYFVSTRTGRDNIWAINAETAMLAAGLSPSEPVATVPTDQ
ncbi:MAG: PD40 domain-containing protein [Phycisphaerales bacterium]|nr:PD40 domain-containing protein [Phycisphaerales bacterium]